MWRLCNTIKNTQNWWVFSDSQWFFELQSLAICDFKVAAIRAMKPLKGPAAPVSVSSKRCSPPKLFWLTQFWRILVIADTFSEKTFGRYRQGRVNCQGFRTPSCLSKGALQGGVAATLASVALRCATIVVDLIQAPSNFRCSWACGEGTTDDFVDSKELGAVWPTFLWSRNSRVFALHDLIIIAQNWLNSLKYGESRLNLKEEKTDKIGLKIGTENFALNQGQKGTTKNTFDKECAEFFWVNFLVWLGSLASKTLFLSGQRPPTFQKILWCCSCDFLALWVDRRSGKTTPRRKVEEAMPKRGTGPLVEPLYNFPKRSRQGSHCAPWMGKLTNRQSLALSGCGQLLETISKEGYWGRSKRGHGKWRNSCAIVTQ